MISTAYRWNLPTGAADPVMDIVAQRIMELTLREKPSKQLTDRDYSEILQLVSQYPACCQQKYSVTFQDGSTCIQYPLSTLLKSRETPLSLIQSVVEAEPQALFEATNGFRPIDLACWKNASLEIVEYLHSRDNTAIRTPCRNGAKMLPLHTALKFCTEETAGVVDFLLEQYPESVKIRDAFGKLALHHAVAASGGVSVKHVQRLLSLCSESAMATDRKGWTALHHACRNRSCNAAVVSCLLEAAPQALLVPNHVGNTPLKLAAMYQTPETLQLLSQRCSVNQQDEDEEFSLLHLAARCNSVESVTFLAEQFPQLLATPSHNATTPLHCACDRTDDPFAVVQALIRRNPALCLVADGEDRLPMAVISHSPKNNKSLRLLRQQTAFYRKAASEQ